MGQSIKPSNILKYVVPFIQMQQSFWRNKQLFGAQGYPLKILCLKLLWATSNNLNFTFYPIFMMIMILSIQNISLFEKTDGQNYLSGAYVMVYLKKLQKNIYYWYSALFFYSHIYISVSAQRVSSILFLFLPDLILSLTITAH